MFCCCVYYQNILLTWYIFYIKFRPRMRFRPRNLHLYFFFILSSSSDYVISTTKGCFLLLILFCLLLSHAEHLLPISNISIIANKILCDQFSFFIVVFIINIKRVECNSISQNLHPKFQDLKISYYLSTNYF